MAGTWWSMICGGRRWSSDGERWGPVKEEEWRCIGISGERVAVQCGRWRTEVVHSEHQNHCGWFSSRVCTLHGPSRSRTDGWNDTRFGILLFIISLVVIVVKDCEKFTRGEAVSTHILYVNGSRALRPGSLGRYYLWRYIFW